MTNGGGAGALKRRHEVSQPFTRKILLAMRGWHWQPLFSELPVADAGAPVATAADWLVRAGGRLLLVELKNGYHGTWDLGRNSMQGPLEGLYSDSPRNQSHVQLLMTKSMLEGLGVKVDGAYIVRAHANGVTPEPLFPQLIRRQGVVVAHVRERLRRRRRGGGGGGGGV